MPLLFVKCKSCGKDFSSMFNVPIGTTLENNGHVCPHCKKTAQYSTPDYFEAPPTK